MSTPRSHSERILNNRSSTSTPKPTTQKQNLLKNMRAVDDHIVGSLNSSLPTSSFKHAVSPQATCQDLFQQLLLAHSQREQAIKECIVQTADALRDLKARREDNRDDVSLDKCFKSEQRKVTHLTNSQFITGMGAITYTSFSVANAPVGDQHRGHHQRAHAENIPGTLRRVSEVKKKKHAGRCFHRLSFTFSTHAQRANHKRK